MDYLDHAKLVRNNLMLLLGYVLIGVAIVIAALILLYQAYGFGIDKNGAVIQKSLTFFSSQPQPADIYIDDVRKGKQTNTRFELAAGIYKVKLTRAGYHDWQRTVVIEGGGVEHFDYPFLFPQKLSPKKVQSFPAAPNLMTQSPDRRWLLMQASSSLAEFTLYDLKDSAKQPVTVTLPAALLATPATAERWQLVSWADDNDHVLLQHVYDDKTEYILLDRSDPAQSLNLNQTLAVNPTELKLSDKKYDKYYLYDVTTAELRTVSLKATTPELLLQRVLAYQTYADDTVLYVTDSNAPNGKVALRLKTGAKTITVRHFAPSPSYLVDLTKYDGSMYVAAGATADDRVYVYHDPAAQLVRHPDSPAAPARVLRVPQPNYLSFSATAQFIVTESGNEFSVYDIENETGFSYTTSQPLDAPQAHASWMDGHRLLYVSGSRLLVFDYDHANQRQLTTAGSTWLPAFNPDFTMLYTLAPTAAGSFELQRTSLLTPADQ